MVSVRDSLLSLCRERPNPACRLQNRMATAVITVDTRKEFSPTPWRNMAKWMHNPTGRFNPGKQTTV
jgi:hypothetical protein